MQHEEQLTKMTALCKQEMKLLMASRMTRKVRRHKSSADTSHVLNIPLKHPPSFFCEAFFNFYLICLTNCVAHCEYWPMMAQTTGMCQLI